MPTIVVSGALAKDPAHVLQSAVQKYKIFVPYPKLFHIPVGEVIYNMWFNELRKSNVFVGRNIKRD